jgi:hypothetical protein
MFAAADIDFKCDQRSRQLCCAGQDPQLTALRDHSINILPLSALCAFK